jgi:membrane protein DedA with SNARE-associated domain
VEQFFGYFDGIPPVVLYVLIFVASFLEGLLPIVPGDLATAFFAFLAARAGGHFPPTMVAVVLGSVSGALTLWYLGLRLGADWLARTTDRLGFHRAVEGMESAEGRVEDAYRRYGWIALLVARMVPGVRAVVPAAAGALRIPFWEVAAILTSVSLVWYGSITWLAFRMGTDWAVVQATVTRVLREMGLGASVVALILVVVGVVIWRRRRRR